jgi:hypothetical protein
VEKIKAKAWLGEKRSLNEFNERLPVDAKVGITSKNS